MRMRIPVTVKYHGPKAPFAVYTVEMNKGDSKVLTHKKNITRRSWDTNLMPDTAISRVNKLASNEPYRFIFKDCICRPIGYIGITGVHRNADYSNKNQAPQDPPHKFQSTEEAEEGPVITDPNIDPDINH